ncbi:MAG: hypothetical protein JXA21_12760 [Anaerolineae bacterium]|nr:hypothetical protein [Anaerolineae bacterium]
MKMRRIVSTGLSVVMLAMQMLMPFSQVEAYPADTPASPAHLLVSETASALSPTADESVQVPLPEPPVVASHTATQVSRVMAFGVGNNNYGQQQRDTDNPENHPGRHFAGPVNLLNGNFYLTMGDFFIPGRGLSLQLARSYNSLAAADGEVGDFGPGWTHSYETRVQTSGGESLTVIEGDGAHHVYQLVGPCPGGSSAICYSSPPGLYRELRLMNDGSYLLLYKNGFSQTFDNEGKLIEIRDQYKNRLSLYYYGVAGDECPLGGGPIGKLCRVDDPTGMRALLFYYTNVGLLRIAQVTEWIEDAPMPGRSITYQYDPNGNLVDVAYPEEPLGQQNYFYDHQQMISYNDPRQPAGVRQAEEIGYDTSNRVITTTYLSNETTDVSFTVSYDPPTAIYLSDPAQSAIGITEVRDGAGQLSRVEYDINGNITYEGDYFYDYGWWWGKWWWWHPTYWWLLYRKVDANSHETLYEYDDWGNTTTVVTALGTEQRYLWEEPYYVSLPSGALTRGNLISATNSAGLTIEYVHDYDLNLLTEIQSAPTGEMIVSSYRSDAYGQLVMQVDPLLRTTSYEYDAFGNTTTITDAAGNVTHNLYDDVGRPVLTIDQIGAPTNYVYDEADRLLTVMDAMGGVTAYTYSADGRDNLTQLVNANGITTTYRYDALDRLVAQTNSLGQRTMYVYDNANRLSQRLDADGRATLYTYDAKSRMRQSEYYAAGAMEPYQTNRFVYDGAGNLVWMDNENVRLAYTYDPLDQRTSVEMWTPAWGISQTLDLLRQPATGNLASVAGASGAYHVDYGYDAFNHVQTVNEIVGSDIYSTTYLYDPAGRMVHQIYPSVSGISEAYEYDPTNHLTGLIYTGAGGSTWAEYTYDYDERGSMTGEVDTGDIYTYTYDILGRVSAADGKAMGRMEYSYDAVGNRLTVGTAATTTQFTYDAHDRLLSAGNATLAYNEMGARTSLQRTGPSPVQAADSLNGGATAIQTPTGTAAPAQAVYVYDNDMRLLRVQEDGQIISYLYDPLGNLIGYTDAAGYTRYYLRNGADVYMEVDATGTVIAHYIIGAQGVLGMMRDGVRYMLLYDGRGRVRWLVNTLTGVVVHSYGPDLFDPGTGLIDFYNPIRMAGAWWFPEVQLILFGGGVFWDPWFGGFLAKAWPWLYWPFGPFQPWRPVFRFWPWPWPWPRPWGWPWPYPWPYLWSWPGAWVRPWIIWPIWPWGLRFWWPWWYWRWWWGWHWWGHWWCWHPWAWWYKWWWYPWWHPWAWWGYWWWPWWWWSSCWWWPWHWWWWIWWWPWGWFWGPGNFWWCWWWWWPRPWWSWPWMWPPILGPPEIGDAPDLPYPSRQYRQGAVHGIWWYEWLGVWRDGEWGSHQIDADRYDDGVHADPLAGTLTFTATVAHPLNPARYGPGRQIYVNGWVDWNQDGNWDNPGEQITDWSGYPGSAGWPSIQPSVAVVRSFSVPDTAFGANDLVTLWLRFRLSYATDWENPYGYTRFGEVEDHRLVVARPHRPGWDGGSLGVDVSPVITYAVVVTDVTVSITPHVPITPVWTVAPVAHGPAAPSAAGNVLTIEHAPFTNGQTYVISLSSGATYPAGDPVLPDDFSVTASSCVPVTQVVLSRLTLDPVYTGDIVTFQADLSPASATYPITYQITTDEVAAPVQTTMAGSFTFTRTFATNGDHDIEIAAWNCAMLPADAVHDAMTVTVLTRPVMVNLTAVNLTLSSGGTLYTDTVASFALDFVPNDATLPISYMLEVDGLSAGGVLTTTEDPESWTHIFGATGTHTVTVEAWNAPMQPSQAVSDTVVVYITPYGVCIPITGVDLALTTPGAIYTDTVAAFSADILPQNATYPYTYTIDGGPPQTVSQSVVTFTRTYPMTGTYTVTFAAWNCAMTNPVTDSVTFTVVPHSEPTDHFIFLPLVLRDFSSP